jgi:hypothetical protein
VLARTRDAADARGREARRGRLTPPRALVEQRHGGVQRR